MTPKNSALEAAEAAHKAAADRLRRERQKQRARERREADRAALELGREVLAALELGRTAFESWYVTTDLARFGAEPVPSPEPAPEPATGPAPVTPAIHPQGGGWR